jgi:hypothetical protein
MTNEESSLSKFSQKLKSVFADLLLLAGLGLMCWGVFRFSIPAGLVLVGLVMIVLARSIAPEKKKI